MYKPVTSQNLALFFSLATMLLSAPSFAQKNDIYTTQNGHAIVQDVEKPGTRIEFDEDQDEVYRAVQKGYIRPFSELYAAVENDLYGRIIKVELEEDDNEWVYELKILFNNSVLKVEYDAATLEMLEVKGRNFNKALKPPQN
ncbi:hypothetical protein V6959_000141 [Vibrio parahaemolyticus]